MSTTRRLISGTAAAWARIVLTIAIQIIIVPLFLGHWTVEVFGVWLALQSIISLLTTLDFGFQTLLEFEFLKLKANLYTSMIKLFWSAIATGLLLSLAQILVILVLINSNLLNYLLRGNLVAHNATLYREAGIVLLLQGFGWLVNSSAAGLVGRMLAPYGYYPRIAWWYVFTSNIF